MTKVKKLLDATRKRSAASKKWSSGAQLVSSEVLQEPVCEDCSDSETLQTIGDLGDWAQ